MVIDSTAKVEVQRVGHAATLLVQRPPIGLVINITLVELERLAAELTEDARRWRKSCEQNFYAVLGVDRTASADEIKKAYRKLARRYHTDGQVGDEEKLKTVNAAYEILSDSVKRKQHDQVNI